MTSEKSGTYSQIAVWIGALAAIVLFCTSGMLAQNAAYERSFAQSKAVVEKALQQIQSAMSGRLPVLEGFAAPGEHPLNSYRRGFYQGIAQVGANASGETVVRLTTKVTAWYADPSVTFVVNRTTVSPDAFE